MNGKIQAQTSDASVRVEAASMAHLGTRCFLCPQEIGESEPRRFYQGKNAMLLGHISCIDKFEAEQERAKGEVIPSSAPSSTPETGERTDWANPQEYREHHGGPEPIIPNPERSRGGPTHIRFNTFADLQNWIVRSGPIDLGVAVSLQDTLLHDGSYFS